MTKPIIFSSHAKRQMLLRGTEENEAITTIRSTAWQPAKYGKFHACLRFDFNQLSPVNQQFYQFKTVDVIFVDEPNEIVVVTVKVYYHN